MVNVTTCHSSFVVDIVCTGRNLLVVAITPNSHSSIKCPCGSFVLTILISNTCYILAIIADTINHTTTGKIVPLAVFVISTDFLSRTIAGSLSSGEKTYHRTIVSNIKHRSCCSERRNLGNLIVYKIPYETTAITIVHITTCPLSIGRHAYHLILNQYIRTNEYLLGDFLCHCPYTKERSA